MPKPGSTLLKCFAQIRLNPPKMFRLLSDLHAEFYPTTGELWARLDLPTEVPSEEILLLAGDIGWPVDVDGSMNPEFTTLLTAFRQRWRHVVLVPGNHEYYPGLEIEQTEAVLQRIGAATDVHVLQKASLDLGSFRILGCTLWSEMSPNAYGVLNDRFIKGNTYPEHILRHHDHRTWLTRELAATTQPTIVLTHHLPTFELIHPFYRSQDNTGYATALDELIVASGKYVKLWACGHTHERAAVTLGGVPLHTNPLGYPGELRRTTCDWNVLSL